MVEMVQMWVALAEFQRPAVAEPERDAVALDPHDFRRVTVEQPEAGVVAGPANAVAGTQLQGLGPVDLDRAALRTDRARPPGPGLSIRGPSSITVPLR